MSLPYADDFCLISTNLLTHQKLIDKIHSQVTSMGMKLKPSKCRSFSLTAGKPSAVPFHIGDSDVPSIRDEEQKFLGKLLFFHGKPEETFNLVKDIFVEGIANIDKAMVRDEYKLWIYSKYFLPSKRFLLTVHTLTKTQLQALDTLTDKAIKRWVGLPRSATNVFIHMTQALDIKSISQLYTEMHTVSHVRTRLQGDSIVNAAIDCTLEREGLWTTKQSTIVHCEATFATAKDTVNTAECEIPTVIKECDFNKSVKNTVKKHMASEHDNKCLEKVKSLAVQGKILELAAAESTDFTWKSFLYDLKKGTLKFLANAHIDTLPTAANLKRWKKSSSDKCKLCKGRQTTAHCLNICKVAMDTGRWTWRHNNIVNYVVNSLDITKYTVFSDIEGHEAPGGGTVPPEIIVTNLKPDITIWDKVNNRFNIFELTVPLDVNISQRNIDKSNKYAHFATDITHINTTVTAFEISSTGNVSSDNKKSLTSLHKFCKPGIKLSTFIKNISSLSIYSSYHIWLCRNDPVFVTPSYLPAPFQPNP